MNKTSKEELMQKIRELSFVKTELELFLDAAPNNKLALDQFHKTLDALIAAKEEYEANYGPITTEGVSRDRWNWIDGPWPWQREGEMPAPDAPLNCRGERT
jgi:spore coat protein JB